MRETRRSLWENTDERDTEVHIDRELKFDQQVEMVPNKANKMLCLNMKVIYLPGWTNYEKTGHTNLFRPILEHGNVARASTLKRDQHMMENVQRRTTKLVPELKNLKYGDMF